MAEEPQAQSTNLEADPVAEQAAVPVPEQGSEVSEQGPEKPVNNILLAWQAPEFVYYEKDTKWFIVGGLATLLLIAIAAFLQQWIMIALVVVLAGVLFQHARREPRVLEYQITELGILVGKQFHPFNELKSFWVIYNPPVEVLGLETTKRLQPQIQIQLGEQDPLAIKQLLHPHLPEQEKRQEDWLDAFGRIIRF